MQSSFRECVTFNIVRVLQQGSAVGIAWAVQICAVSLLAGSYKYSSLLRLTVRVCYCGTKRGAQIILQNTKTKETERGNKRGNE